MIQLVINTNLLREIDERKLINAYARFMYNEEKDTTDDIQIKENLKQLLDWDENGEIGLEVYCSKFESIKRKDWDRLIHFIKINRKEIELLSRPSVKDRKLENIKIIRNSKEAKIERDRERCIDENYIASSNGKKPKPCIYEGRTYSSRQECMYKEGISQSKLYRYLEKTGQV